MVLIHYITTFDYYRGGLLANLCCAGGVLNIIIIIIINCWSGSRNSLFLGSALLLRSRFKSTNLLRVKLFHTVPSAESSSKIQITATLSVLRLTEWLTEVLEVW